MKQLLIRLAGISALAAGITLVSGAAASASSGCNYGSGNNTGRYQSQQNSSYGQDRMVGYSDSESTYSNYGRNEDYSSPYMRKNENMRYNTVSYETRKYSNGNTRDWDADENN